MADADEAKGAGSGPKLTGPQGSQGYYAVLGVEFGTPTEQIQKKYKRAAILYTRTRWATTARRSTCSSS